MVCRFICLLSIISRIALHAQDADSLKSSPDTLDSSLSKRISFKPNGAFHTLKSLGFYVQPLDDPRLFQFSAGMSIINTLRGQVPNLYISPGFITGNPSPLGDGLLVVVDGVPYNSRIAGIANLNTFEFDQVIYLGHGNASGPYGVAGPYGGLVLHSKTGQGHDKPTFEVNSYTTTGWADVTTFPAGQQEREHRWRFSNSVAYSQDFGKVDTRFSYNFGVAPYSDIGTSGIKTRSDIFLHNFKWNTGWNIVPRLKARIILEDNRSAFTFSAGPGNFVEGTKSDYLQGSLLLRYDPLPWLSFSSQGQAGGYAHRYDIDLRPVQPASREEQGKTFANALATMDKKFSPIFSLNAYSGLQYEKTDFHKEVFHMFHAEDRRTYTTRSLLGGVGATFFDQVFMDFNYRSDQLSQWPGKARPVWNTSAAWAFSEATKWSTAWFTWGKIRANVGYHSWDSGHPFPYIAPNPFSTQPAGRQEWKYETGTDLAFFTNRILLSFNYFRKRFENASPRTISQGQTVITVTSYFDWFLTGEELILGIYPLKDKRWFSRIVWTTYRTKVRDGGGPNTIVVADRMSDWLAHMYHLATFNNFTLSGVIEMQKGGETYSILDNSPSLYDATNVRLRDLSMGYQLPMSITKKWRLQKVNISLIGRNLLLLYSKSGRDLEKERGGAWYQSASLGLGVVF